MDLKRHFVLDVEADGPCPGMYNMISLALVSLNDLEVSYKALVAPITGPGLEEARAVSGVTYEEQCPYHCAGQVMPHMVAWVEKQTERQRAIIWSDNPAFDWQWWNYYCHVFAGRNPAGFSARRIGDLYAGFKGTPWSTQSWKKKRETKHTHDPREDARGNAEALLKILKEMGAV